MLPDSVLLVLPQDGLGFHADLKAELYVNVLQI